MIFNFGKLGGKMSISDDEKTAAQTQEELLAFIEAFARISVSCVKRDLSGPAVNTGNYHVSALNWTDLALLNESGLTEEQVADQTSATNNYLHIDVACASNGREIKRRFLDYTGLSPKQQKTIFPSLFAARPPRDRLMISREVARLNAWLDWIRTDGFNPQSFITYRRSLEIHGRTQNLSGAIGATGAVIAFVDAIKQLNPDAIIGHVGDIPPANVRSPQEIFDWRERNPNHVTKALLLVNGRALVFASSKDANIFQSLGRSFADAEDALNKFNEVKDDREARAQSLHEFAVGEVKTATDVANLHERMGLASRETQTELRTDRFLMMAVLTRDILDGGVQRRTINNRDLTRFSQTFNLHHCWGWDGGRERNPEHWRYFIGNVQRWCGL